MDTSHYVKIIAATPEDGYRIFEYFVDQEFYVTQHGTGCIVKIYGTNLRNIEKHLNSRPDLQHVLAYDPVEK